MRQVCSGFTKIALAFLPPGLNGESMVWLPMVRSVSVQLTPRELSLFLNTIRARRIYEPCRHTLAREIWQPWMTALLEKLMEASAAQGEASHTDQPRGTDQGHHTPAQTP